MDGMYPNNAGSNYKGNTMDGMYPNNAGRSYKGNTIKINPNT